MLPEGTVGALGIAVLSSLWGRALPSWLGLTATMLLFTLSARLSDETVGRAAKHPQHMERTSDGLRRIGPVTTMTLLGACSASSSNTCSPTCPPVVGYPTALQEQAAVEIEVLPHDSAVDGIMSDYHVMRQQARACE